MPITPADLRAFKARREPIPVITAYDYPSARLAEAAGVPVLLVGDSVGMTVLGAATTLGVTLDIMVHHARAVAKGASEALVIADLPFLTYADPMMAVASAGRLLQEAGVHAVKLEGGLAVVETVKKLTELGVPVMGHLGFTPQSQHQLGVKVQAKDEAGARRLLADALALEGAGAFAIVLELVPAALAAAVSQRLSIPTIGIGAGGGCDGQVQVWHDLLGLGEGRPRRHTKVFAEAGATITEGLKAYVAEVKSGAFPTKANGSSMDADVLARALT